MMRVTLKAPEHRLGKALAGIGIMSLLIELERYWLYDHPIHPQPIIVGSILGFTGFFIISSDKTVQGAKVLIDGGIGFVAALRSGRRATDPVIIPPVITEPADAAKKE
jgi:hypothetical protein